MKTLVQMSLGLKRKQDNRQAVAKAGLKKTLTSKKLEGKLEECTKGRSTTPCIRTPGLEPRATTIGPYNTSTRRLVADGLTTMWSSTQWPHPLSPKTASEDTATGLADTRS